MVGSTATASNPVNDEYETATRQVFYAWAPGNGLGSYEPSMSKGHAHNEPHLSAGHAFDTGPRPDLLEQYSS